ICYVPMITSIPNFEFVAVDVINLNSKNLTLSNIHTDENGNQVVLDVHQDELEAFTQDFDENYNVDEEYIYSNGAWVSNGKLKHNVVFDLAEAGSLTRRYSELDKIDVPYVEGSIIPFETESGTKYYKLLGWYYDASYLNPVEDVDSMYMGNKALVYYAKTGDVTIQLEIHSSFDEVYTLTTYEGVNISSLIEELYNIKNVDNVIYKFNGLVNEQEESVSVDELTNGSYVLTVVWEEVHYAFYALYNGLVIELQEGNDTAFLESDVVIAKGNEYLVYAASKLTPDYIMKNFASLFVLNEEMERFELEVLDLAAARLNAYDLITFDVPKEELNTKGYYGFFIPKSASKDITELLPNGTYDTFEINAWVSDSSTYYSLSDIKEITGAQTLTAYVSTQLSYFEFETIDSGATISAYTGSAETVIFPEYALLGGKYVKVVEIKEMTNDSQETYSAFTENTTMRTLVFNESLARIGGNAFKNCDGLENVYFSKNLLASNVAKDAFFFV
ncbi:MAG: leucine-rich repeat domain-containing protein, partial [Anaeroplasmataceae bacterium]|nr:leucine-rich repeat domain-containing protein [Anaeroplasmataceae bacterium]